MDKGDGVSKYYKTLIEKIFIENIYLENYHQEHIYFKTFTKKICT